MRNKFSLQGRSFNAKYLKYFIILAILASGIFFINKAVKSATTSTNQTEEKSSLKPAIAAKEMGKDIAIPLGEKNSEEETESITLRIENVELRDEIIVQGQKASSLAGRSFFVVNLKLTNKLEQGVEVNTKDYLRLGYLGNESELLAPDIHDDPVLIQAISTKLTRVAFPVNDTEKKFFLQVGEIAGEKERIEIDLSQ